MEAVLEKLVVEQLSYTMPTDLRIWVAERKPADGAEAGRLADDYIQARRHIRQGKPDDKDKSNRGTVDARRCHKCGAEGHWRRNCPVKEEPGVDGSGHKDPRSLKKPERTVKCYNCGRNGHISMNCPDKASYFCKDVWGQPVARIGRVEGTAVSDILLDTGCTRTMVRGDLVPEEKLLPGEAATVLCAHGDTVLYPLARVRIDVEGVGMEVRAAVSESLPVSVLLGTDVPELGRLLHSNPLVVYTKGMDHALVTTRAQLKRDTETIAEQERCQVGSGVRPRALAAEETKHQEEEPDMGGSGLAEVTGRGEGVMEQGEEDGSEEAQGDGSEGGNLGDMFAEDLFGQTVERKKLSRRQKREERRAHGLERAKDQPSRGSQPLGEGLQVTVEELKQLQATEEELAGIEESGGFFRRNGILYRRWTPREQPESSTVEQIVLPRQCRRAVLQLAHSTPLSGHLGKKKTAARIMRRFYWPTLFRDVADYCRSCTRCQKSSRRRVPRAPMIPLPVISEPFERIAMDVVGPLPRSRSGHRYVLVICDYGTRYPEAIPMKTVDAEAVAEELLKLFTRVGIPKEILTDQGTNFTSQLLAELYRLLRVNALRTTPYHPQTDGLVERFNGTLKGMLRKSAQGDGRDWDKLLPYLLFAYRETPQESTGFSPFELLYGRDVRGPLDVVKEEWEASPKCDRSVVSHIMLMRERMEQMMALARENQHQAQRQQKEWYDRTARERELSPGERVLVLLPTTTSKLTAQWHGPYEVLRRIGKVDYLVATPERRKRETIFHINMLRKWNEPASVGYLVTDVTDGEDELEMLMWDGGEEGEPQIGGQLTGGQRKELANLLRQYEDVLTRIPGCTNLAQHTIETGDSRPIRLPPYRLPHAYRDAVRRELEEMQEQGVIEPASSEWAAPIVVVRKKDNSIRLCVDYRRLNTVSCVDAYPMPRIDDLIDLIGQARYISTLDLTKGYWQVPVAEADRAKTGFTSPFGLFVFRRMPFGLQGAPATFQRMMDHFLEGMREFTGAYLDDLIVFSRSWTEHLQHVNTVLNRLRAAGLTAKPKKCQFGMAECVYLGHVVGGGKVQVEESKVDAIRGIATPQTKKEVRAFLGLTGYYRKFIPNYASTATPLTDLTRKTEPNRVNWTADCAKWPSQSSSSYCAQHRYCGPQILNDL